ncbi:MAG: 16S rRNA (guanine(527)-N(7))-methyltransferase RsmG [Flavobacteriales bacterium]|jgi:16S rRNA (guanine527-N7)-methyltransferase|nr:16S rRNA (guanine(527)-N(7))-methyltransferase RsmG [Flavobacteriales bacterium]MBK6551401.1 16S rRNA (guanine(527)-N(7))-methyltransferase RsmG [Flavobacteriales bacterium]MBK7101792.1 16S rRNA (guanine(527)-N(7))-methyltransferase RsmG [Flavobacteriales bacterium]MBK8531821.1 16S rRNA (guanine(527)-N(7))-methyltransferase RsmG [Flavobacteriales bacterium]MBK8707995.1 16S rRNA (guanine(527)-N(7))-methyltransferase RsmG [Flavobacteriales bacterium]
MNSQGLDLLVHYFPELSATQRNQFARLGELYAHWNERVNLISRKDFEHLYERHILHSLGIAKVVQFKKGTRIVDVGTGGGFPLVPLAILFPHCSFHGIDGIGKKITAVKGVIEGLGITNCTAEQVRSMDHKPRYDVIVSRAVTTLPEFIRDTKHLVAKGRGRMYYLKGGELADEILPVRNAVRVYELKEVFAEAFFETKKVVEVTL